MCPRRPGGTLQEAAEQPQESQSSLSPLTLCSVDSRGTPAPGTPEPTLSVTLSPALNEGLLCI